MTIDHPGQFQANTQNQLAAAAANRYEIDHDSFYSHDSLDSHQHVHYQMRLQQQAAEELASLQQDIADENLRLRKEAKRINKMFDKIKQQNRENKIQLQENKQVKAVLKLEKKRLTQQQDEVDYLSLIHI